MIDSKFALKYPMPHSVVHIVDNSEYTGETNVATANDPSLLASIVVSGAPMGEDNKIITLSRSDVISAAYGMGNITAADVKKYGQGVTYPMDLVNQGVPVRFMRVTPANSTYANVSLVVQWRLDNADDKLHVRYLLKEWPESLPKSEFKNTARLNEALVKELADNNVPDGGNTWHQRAFINFIGAGRGGEYNNMATAINLVTQSKRPANVKYQFVTIDKRTGNAVETFYASLVNTNVGNYANPNAIDSVNTIVAKRVPGSSIVVPYLNEDAVEEVYAAYMAHFREKVEGIQDADDYAQEVYKVMNINIFDMVFGNYIYNGTTTDTKMPYYQVDMVTTDLPQLTSNRILCDDIDSATTAWDAKNPEILYNKLINLSVGVTKPDSECYVGDLYLVPSATGSSKNARISVVTNINQYTGVVTSMMIPKIFPLSTTTSGSETAWTTLHKKDGDVSASRTIDLLVYDLGDKIAGKSDAVKEGINDGSLTTGSIIAAGKQSVANSFEIFTLEVTSTTDNNPVYTLHAYDKSLFYDMLDRESHSGRTTGTGNAFGFAQGDAAWNRKGATVVVGPVTEGSLPAVAVNSYNRAATIDGVGTGDRIPVNRLTGLHFGAVPGEIAHDDISSTSFDVKVYPDAYISKWKVRNVSVLSDSVGKGYRVGDELYLSLTDHDKVTGDAESGYVYDAVKTRLTVTQVDENGGIRAVEITMAKDYDASAAGGSVVDITVKDALAATKTLDFYDQDRKAEFETDGTPASVKVAEFTVSEGKAPKQIERYTVSGALGSLMAISGAHVTIPANYYDADQGINPTSAVGGMTLSGGYAGFFDDYDEKKIGSIEYKWRYSALLVKALKGDEAFDRRILSPTRTPAKFLFDAGYNTLVGSTVISNINNYSAVDLINSSTIFTDDEKDDIIFNPDTIARITEPEDIDVKQALYDLMIHRCYDGIPEDKRPEGPGSGIQLYLDSCVTESEMTTLIRDSFIKRFDNPNAVWDIGGFTETETGISYTFTKHIVEDLFRHILAVGINKPYAGKTTAISSNRYSSFFPDLDTTDWGQRENLYLSGGNAWIMQRDGSLERRSQRTLMRDTETSDLLQENNMRTLSRLVYLLQEKIDSYLLEYSSDSVLKSLQDEVNNMFSNWVGNFVDGLDITFERDRNTDGAEILVCYVNVTFRGLILRVPIIVNVNSRQ